MIQKHEIHEETNDKPEPGCSALLQVVAPNFLQTHTIIVKPFSYNFTNILLDLL